MQVFVCTNCGEGRLMKVIPCLKCGSTEHRKSTLAEETKKN